MKISDGVEWGLHCCTQLALLPGDRALPAARLAEFNGVPAAYLAKHLQALSRAGIVEAVQGPRGGYRLAKPAADITLLDVVLAIEGDAPAFRCTEIRQRGPAGGFPPECYAKACGIARAMAAAEAAYRASLRSRTIADLLVGLAQDISPEMAAKGLAWYQEVLR